MTRLQLRNLIRYRLGELTASFWPDDTLNQWINNAGHDIADKTKYIKQDGYMDTVEDQGEYTVSDDFSNWLSILRVYRYDGTNWNKLIQTTEDRLDKECQGWKNAESSIPQQYYWDKERDILGLYPVPDEDREGTDYLQVYYADDFTDLTEDTASLTMPRLLQEATADYVVATGFESRGWGDKANDAWGKYASKIHGYLVKRDTEKEEDDEGLVMRNYRNIR